MSDGTKPSTATYVLVNVTEGPTADLALLKGDIDTLPELVPCNNLKTVDIGAPATVYSN